MNASLFITALIVSSACFAQSRKYIFYYKNNGELVNTKDSMDYMKTITGPDAANLYHEVEYYRSGKMKSAGRSSLDFIMEGIYFTFWPNGNKKKSGFYTKGQLIGQDSSFFFNGKLHTVLVYSATGAAPFTDRVPHPLIDSIKTCNDSTGKALVINGEGYYKDYDDNSGVIIEEGPVKDYKKVGEWKGGIESEKLSYKENYDDTGTLLSGISTDSAGTHLYTTRYVNGGFEGGIDAFYKYLTRVIRYPVRSMEKNIQGRVTVSFIIDKEGKSDHFKVLQSVNQEMDAEATRVLKAVPEWIPGTAFGRKASQTFIIPIAFTLASKSYSY